MAYLTVFNIYNTRTPGQVLEIKCAQEGWQLFPQGHASWEIGSFPAIPPLKAKWATEGLPAQLPGYSEPSDKLHSDRVVSSRMQISPFIFKSNYKLQ